MHDTDFDDPSLEEAVIKRCNHYPLQYLLGYWSFCNETYRVNENTLIPRADTERLVELAVKNLPERARFIDLCTGSGCIAISTLAARPDCRAVAVDLYEGALDVASENAETNGVGERIGFLRADVMKPEFMEELGTFDCILSNPPYIESGEIADLAEELTYEPKSALDGGDDGLDFYRAIIGGYGKYLAEGGMMFLEIGWDQAKSVSAIASENRFRCEVFKDYGGNDRVALLTVAERRSVTEDIAAQL
jgi:release factor glutamine methyltransferase